MENMGLIGQRFEMLTVIEDSGERDRTSILWRCKCDCGGEILVKRHQLTSGAVANCGCIPKKRTVFIGAEDLTGRQFGELAVLRRMENDKHNKTRWLCRCSCGNLHTVTAQKLKSGSTQSCGCKRQRTFHGKDLTGQRFGRLVALHPVNTKQYTEKKAVWRCRCDCGNETDIAASSLVKGLSKSCGCLNQERRSELHDHLHDIEETCVERLIRAQKSEAENKAGFRGLFLTKGGKYRVTITFQKVHYHIGYFDSFEAAKKARLDAEESLHAGFISAYSRWQEQAEADPEWAENNPFFYQVQRIEKKFQVITNDDRKDSGDMTDRVLQRQTG